MDSDEQRDYAEEKYLREFCVPCGTSPCGWDGQPDGFHTYTGTDEEMAVPIGMDARGRLRIFRIRLADLRRAARSGGTIRFLSPPGYRFGSDRRLHPDNEAEG